MNAMHRDSKYILFLDDDIRLHPGTIGAVVAKMEENPEVDFAVWVQKRKVIIDLYIT